MNPLIGIIMRPSKSDSGKDIAVVYDKIIKAIYNSGGIPLGIPHGNIDQYLDICHGFIIQGGDEFDKVDMNNIKLLKEKDIPLLGICLGMQEMAYIYGGMIKDITNHLNTCHEINIIKDSLLYKIIGKDKILVNSRHRSAITKTKIDVSSYSNDFIIEAVEDKTCKFFLGVQWHPEDMDDDDNKKIFDYFVKICNY